jgi:hypothetical protein
VGKARSLPLERSPITGSTLVGSDIAIHFHPNLIFVGKARSLPLERSPITGSTLVGSGIAIHFHPSLIFVGKARSLPLERSPITGSTLVGLGIACKYFIMIEVNGSDKYSSLLQQGRKYSFDKFIVQAPGGQSYKTFYSRNLRILKIS